MESVTVGLDIGSSAIRAAEVHVAKDGRRSLHRYGQVGLPVGYVVDGEINNVHGTAAALRRLWAEAGFTSREVIVGVSGPRVFVRQADVPALNSEDLRSSLKFDAQELVPIPMEDATFDFSPLSEPKTDEDGKSTQRILLVAAHKEILRSYIATLSEAGLVPTVMDAAPLALMRAVGHVDSHSGADGLEVIVSIGAELTTVAVRDGSTPLFIRSLTLGGARLTESIANGLHLEMSVAERMKRGGAVGADPQLAQARRAMAPEVRDLAEELRATIEFFVSQSGGTVSRLLVTGGASLTEGLAFAVGGDLPALVARLDPLAQFEGVDQAVAPEERARVAATAATAIGLALWSTDEPLIRLSLLPDEVLAARRSRRLVMAAAGGLLGLVVLLGALGGGELLRAQSAEHKLQTEQARVTALTADVTSLTAKTSIHNQVKARTQLLASSLGGDVDWVRVLGQLASVMPNNLALTSFSGSTNAGLTTASSGSSGIGSVTLSVTGTGGLPAAAAFLNGLQSDPDLGKVWITGINVKSNGGQVTFSSSPSLTPVSYSNRAERIGK